jgi:hypothetical protein
MRKLPNSQRGSWNSDVCEKIDRSDTRITAIQACMSSQDLTDLISNCQNRIEGG